MPKDPYRYFRIEARELLDGLTQGILQLEAGDDGRPLYDRLMRLAHTLKGAARVVGQGEVAEQAHAMEELIVTGRGAEGPAPGELVNRLLALVDSCNERLKPVFAPQEQSATLPPPGRVEEAEPSVRTDVSEVDAIHYALADAAVRLGAIRPDSAEFERVEGCIERLLGLASETRADGPDAVHALRASAEEARDALREFRRTLGTNLDRSRQDLDRVRDRVGDLRLLPAREVFAALGRTARDAADSLKKRISFETSGGEHRLDAHILAALRDALIQLVRNAVAHGIEDPRERARAAKSPEGRVRLGVSRVGRRIQFRVEDDGRGIDMAAIRRVLIARGLASAAEAEALGTAAAIRLLFQGGFSTATSVTEVMGRGVGLDVVRATVNRLNGEVEFRSEPGLGTCVEVVVPVSMESLDVLGVGVGDSTWLIPFDAVLHTLRISESDLSHSAAGSTLVRGREIIPFRTLAELTGISSTGGGRPSSGWAAVLIRARGTTAAVGVDRLEGVRNVVVRPLPEECGSVTLVASTTLDENGDPQLVFDPAALIESVRAKTGRATRSTPAPPPPILIVDDSLTTRMLEQSVLETAGYQVHQATSGEEALEMAKRNRYSLFVVDVEMPGMTGFELLERFRSDPALNRVPAILVTSRASSEDLRRGEQAGARAHIAKGDFHEGNLLRTIRRLIGGITS